MIIGLWPKKLYFWEVLSKDTSPTRICQNTVHRRGLRGPETRAGWGSPVGARGDRVALTSQAPRQAWAVS